MQIGRFKIAQEDAKQGGQAFVYLITDPVSGERIALKAARPSEWSHRRMRQEIQAHDVLDHPNILPIIEHADDYSWYTAAQAECSLEEFGVFARDQWMVLRAGMLGLASALAYAHDHGFIHRDISPGNVLIFANRWVLSDWGFVYAPPKTGARMTQRLEHFGTPQFSAPEQIIDPRNVTSAADIFAFGQLAAWATGLRPGEGSVDDYPFTAWWRLLIDGTTRYEPSMRWTMQDLRAHLRSLPTTHRQMRLDEAETPSPVVASRDEVCPHCQRTSSRDASGRCIDCHTPFVF